MVLYSKLSLYFGTLVFIALGYVGGVAFAGSINDAPADEGVFTITLELKEETQCNTGGTASASVVECALLLEDFEMNRLGKLKKVLEAGSADGSIFAATLQRLPSGRFGLMVPQSNRVDYEKLSNLLHEVLEYPDFSLVETVSLEFELMPVNDAGIVPWQTGATVGAVAGFLYALAFSAFTAILTVSRQRRKKSD